MQLSRKLEGILNQSGNEDLPITLRALIDPNRSGALIGKGGIVHKQIEDMFNVRMILHSNVGSIGRLASLFGHPTQVAKAWRDALLRMYGMEQFEFSSNKKLGLDFLIPKPLADRLIQDQSFFRIRLGSKVYLHLKQPPIPHTNELVLQITINFYHDCLNNMERAVCMLGKCFQDHPDLALSPLNVYYVPTSLRLPQKAIAHDSDNFDDLSYISDELHDDDVRWHEQLLAE